MSAKHDADVMMDLLEQSALFRKALEAAEQAEVFHARCEECEGSTMAPETCEHCFPSADKARCMRRAALGDVAVQALWAPQTPTKTAASTAPSAGEDEVEKVAYLITQGRSDGAPSDVIARVLASAGVLK
jgi:hypothetical protein